MLSDTDNIKQKDVRKSSKMLFHKLMKFLLNSFAKNKCDEILILGLSNAGKVK
jgi:ribosome biogenesis GTPase A